MACESILDKAKQEGEKMAKVIVTEREIDCCELCDFARSVLSLETRCENYRKNILGDPLKCTRKRPHKPIPDNDTIPEWCPLPDWK